MVVASPPLPRRGRVLMQTRTLIPPFMRGRPALVIGSLMLLVIVVLCIGAPLFAKDSPTAINPLKPLLPPGSPGHLLGTDDFGRDMLSRVLYGGRYDLAIAFGATTVTLVFGMLVGLFAGHFGRPFGTIAMRIVDLVFAFPFIVLVIAILAMLGPSLFNLFIALWVTSWVSYARIAQGRTLSASGYGYIIAARALGFSHPRIIFRHTLPSVLPACLIYAMVDAVGNVLLGASLGFLGIGIRPPTPEWGSMIAEGQNFILSQWWIAIVPGIALVLLGVALSLIGDGLADVLRPEDAR